MSSYIEDKISQSSKDFENTVLPRIQQWLGDGEVIAVEGHASDELRKKLDMYSGIDAIYVEDGVGVKGVASRVRYGKDRRTFTISCPDDSSEYRSAYEKRRLSLAGEYLYPYWTVQAHLDEPDGQLLSVGMCRTKELIEEIEKGTENRDYVKKELDNRHDFYSIKWSVMPDRSVHTWISEESW